MRKLALLGLPLLLLPRPALATDHVEVCRDPGRDEYGDREGAALPYRLVLSGTFTLGG